MPRPRILVTGASGFVAAHLLPVLDNAGYALTGTGPCERPRGIPASCEWYQGDLRDPTSLKDLPRKWWGVVHLAAESIPGDFRSIAPLLGNVAMTVALLEHVRDCRVLCISSCHVYTPSSSPVKETAAINPRGRYGFSKHLTEQTALAFSDRLDIRIARPFNHLGRGMRPELVGTLSTSAGLRGKGHEPAAADARTRQHPGFCRRTRRSPRLSGNSQPRSTNWFNF